jgi:kynurenine formamidase
MAKSGVLSQRITTTMHATTHIDAPAHVVQGTPFIDEVPLPHFFGTGIVVNLPKKKWEPITGDDLEKACGHVIRKNDVLILNTGWHHDYEDGDYFAYCPGFVASAGYWMGIFDDASKAKEFTDWTIFSTNPEVGIHQVPPLV